MLGLEGTRLWGWSMQPVKEQEEFPELNPQEKPEEPVACTLHVVIIHILFGRFAPLPFDRLASESLPSC